jgi:dienelactone hydrolase
MQRSLSVAWATAVLVGLLGIVSAKAAWDPESEVLVLRVPRADGSDRIVPAMLTTPKIGGKHPAVILLHDGYGIDRRTSLLAEGFAAEGWMVLEPELDSVSADGFRPLEAERWGDTIDARSVLPDLAGLLELLARYPAVDLNRIAVVGLGVGGRAALWAARKPWPPNGRSRDTPWFSAYVALYPGCDALLQEGYGRPVSRSATQVAVLHAGADMRDAPGTCDVLQGELRAAGQEPMFWHSFAGATYGWDLGVVWGSSPIKLPQSGGILMEIRSDDGVTQDALRTVVSFLRRALRPGSQAQQ